MVIVAVVIALAAIAFALVVGLGREIEKRK